MAYTTFRELVERMECYTASLQNQLNRNDEFESVVESIPFNVVVARPTVLEILSVNPRHEQWTGYSEEEIRQDCRGYLDKTIHPLSLENIQKFLPEFYRSGEDHRTLAFAQYARARGKADYDPLVTFAKAPTRSDDLVVRILVPPGELESLSRSMEQVVEMDRFKMRNFKRFQQLSQREIQVLKLLADGYNNPDIAEHFKISRQTVETHRKRIKAKLEIASYRDLVKYALAFDLVQF